MPGLTVQTSSPTKASPPAHSPNSPPSRSSSPTRPPYSPITPVLEPARIATASASAPTKVLPPQPIYTHTNQQIQSGIPQPPPIPVDFESNPDVLALKASISILQVQRRNAENDIQALHQTKKRALADVDAFMDALKSGKIKHKSDAIFAPLGEDSGSDDEVDKGTETTRSSTGDADPKKWPMLPAPQNVVRQPTINWNQYGVVGESLDKLHADQQNRPSEGAPQRMVADGSYVFGGEGPRRASHVGVAAPYTHRKDTVANPKKGARR